MPEDNNKNYQNPFLNEEQARTNGQNGQISQGQPMYYPYPPMPPQAQGENGQPMPMYYAYPPMPPQVQGENGQPMYYPYPPMPPQAQGENGQPMYYAYPPMPPQAQGENGQPMYYPYPPMPPQAQGENGQPMYYPYPPMPPQAQQDDNVQSSPQQPQQQQQSQAPAMSQTQQEHQSEAVNVKDDNAGIKLPYEPAKEISEEQINEPKVSPDLSKQAIDIQSQAQPFENSSDNENTYSKQSIQTETNSEEKQHVTNNDDNLNEDGHKVFVSQPVINNKTFSDDNLIVHEPKQDETIFSAPTPVYNPEEIDGSAENTNVSEKEDNNEENEDTQNSFVASMKSLYSGFNSSNTDENNSTESVMNTPISSVASAIDETTDYTDVQTSQFKQQNKEIEPKLIKNNLNSIENQSDTINNVQENVNGQELNKQSIPPSMYQAAPFIDDQSTDSESVSNSVQQEQSGGFENSKKSDDNEKAIIEEEKKQDSQYWEFMNNLLERFDDGNANANGEDNSMQGDAPQVSPPKVTPPSVNNSSFPQDAQPDQSSLENFGKNVEQPTINEGVFSKVFKKNSEKASERNSKNEKFEPKSFEDNLSKNKKLKKRAKPKVKKVKSKNEDTSKNDEKISSNAIHIYKDDKKGSKKFFATVFPTKGDNGKEIARKIIAIVSLIVLIGCIIFFAVKYANKKQNAKEVSNFAQIMQNAETDTDEWSKIRQKYPDVNFPVGMQPKYADLYAMNPDLVGWIRIKGLDIDLPAVQSKNNEYYLRNNFNKEKSEYGAIFVNSKNKIETLDLNTVVFGHCMHSNTQMFTNLKEYRTPEGFKKAPIIEFNTLYGNYKWKVFAVFITNGSPEGDSGYVFNYIFPNLRYESKEQWKKTYGGYINELNQRTLYKTGIDILPTDRLLTLSTCAHDFDNARLVVVARMLREGESTAVDTANIRINKNPRYPQAWYDENNKINPYSGYARWKPVI